MGLVRKATNVPAGIDLIADGTRLVVKYPATIEMDDPRCLRAPVSFIDRVTFDVSPGGTNEAIVTITPYDAMGEVAFLMPMIVFLSDGIGESGVLGDSLTAVTASGAVGLASGGSGMVCGTLTAKKCLQVITGIDGAFSLSIVDSARSGFFVNAVTFSRGWGVSFELFDEDYG